MTGKDEGGRRHAGVGSDAAVFPPSPILHPASSRVAIIGGGYAGMAAAVQLARHDTPVKVFEAGKVPGGRARRVEVGGIVLDNGLHILIGAYAETLRLIELTREAGTPSGLTRLPLELTVHPHFQLRAPRLPAPLHLAVALLRARGLSLSDRLRAAGFIAALRRRKFRLEQDGSVTGLLDAYRQSDALRRYLWHPLCVSALNTAPAQASAQVFLNVLRDSLNGSRADSDLLLPTLDFSALFPERAVAYLASRGGDVRLGTTVRAWRREGDVFRIAGESDTYSHLVLAVAPHRLDSLVEGHPELAEIAGIVAAFEYQPIYSVYLQYPAGSRLPFAMGGIEARYSQWLFDRGRLCGQDGMIGVVISAAGAHQELAQDELAGRVHAELSERFPALGAPLWHRVIAEKRATFSCTPGLRRPANRTPVPGLYLAGDYTASDYPATIEAAVRSGVACANLILRNQSRS